MWMGDRGTRVMRHRPTVAVVDLGAIRHNVRTLKPKGSEVMAVVKANGYGHGSVQVARAAQSAGAQWLGVALVEEGVDLRDAGLAGPILVLTEFPPGSEKEALAAGLTPSLYTDEGLDRLTEAAGALGRRVGVHVKVDTGMHRVGIDPARLVPFVSRLLEAGLELEGLWTHFAKSEEMADPFTWWQLQRFTRAMADLRGAGVIPRYRHAANSAAIMSQPQAHLDLVRLGIAMYGLCPSHDLAEAARRLRPALSWKSAVTMVKRVDAGEAISYGLTYTVQRASTIATVPVGYADGYSRLLGGKAEVLIGGRRYPVAGTVTMDQFMVDCGDERVAPGDEVVLIGGQGDEQITADDVAGWMGTINYEVVCGLSERVPREYVG
jgi:alanine racemase